MKQDSKDVVLKLITEWNQYEFRMNFDVSGNEFLSHVASLMRNMTFPTSVIINSLREVADELEEDANSVEKYVINDEEYGATD